MTKTPEMNSGSTEPCIFLRNMRIYAITQGQTAICLSLQLFKSYYNLIKTQFSVRETSFYCSFPHVVVK